MVIYLGNLIFSNSYYEILGFVEVKNMHDCSIICDKGNEKTLTHALKNPIETLTGRHCGTVLPSMRTTRKATA
jgi:hypothetical protein